MVVVMLVAVEQDKLVVLAVLAVAAELEIVVPEGEVLALVDKEIVVAVVLVDTLRGVLVVVVELVVLVVLLVLLLMAVAVDLVQLHLLQVLA